MLAAIIQDSSNCFVQRTGDQAEGEDGENDANADIDQDDPCQTGVSNKFGHSKLPRCTIAESLSSARYP